MSDRTISDQGVPKLGAAPTQAPDTDAEARLRARLEQQPDDIDALLSLGQLCARHDRFDEARKLFDRVVDLDPRNMESRLVAAGLAGTEGDLDAAEHGYREVLARHPGSAHAHAGLAKVAVGRDQSRAAEEHFRHALKHDPEHLDALLGLGRERLARGDLDQATKLFEHAAAVYPRHPMALLRVAQVLIARGVPLQAARPLTRALEIDPEFGHARFLLAQVDLRRDRAAAAEAGFRKLLEGEAETARAQAGLGDALRAQGRIGEALAAYEAALQADPDNETTTAARAECKAKLGRESEAIADLEAFVGQHPTCAIPRVLLGEMLERSGRSGQALAMWRDAASRDPADLLAQLETALRLEAAGDFAGAAEIAQHGAADPRPQAVLLRARCAVRGKDYVGAEQALRELQVKSLPQDAARERYRLLGLAHDHHRRYDEAVLAFREAQRIGAGVLPSLASASDIRRGMQDLLAEPELDTSPTLAPVLLFGLPGSGVERLAALLADQPGIAVREDRFAGQTDLLGAGDDPRMLRSMSVSELKVLERRYHRVAARAVQGRPACVVDWVPVFDARVLAQVRRVLPGVRVLVAERNAEDAFLDWLAFGWQRDYRMADPIDAAHWWRVAAGQIALASEVLPTTQVDVAGLLADPHGAGAGLAAFLGLDGITPGRRFAQRSATPRGLPVGFGAGHAERYRDALAKAFANLHKENSD